MYQKLVISCSFFFIWSIYSTFVEYLCIYFDRPLSTRNDLRPSAGYRGWSNVELSNLHLFYKHCDAIKVYADLTSYM